jgi:hypothetical protein
LRFVRSFIRYTHRLPVTIDQKLINVILFLLFLDKHLKNRFHNGCSIKKDRWNNPWRWNEYNHITIKWLLLWDTSRFKKSEFRSSEKSSSVIYLYSWNKKSILHSEIALWDYRSCLYLIKDGHYPKSTWSMSSKTWHLLSSIKYLFFLAHSFMHLWEKMSIF